jgi:hypothetical protein
MASSDRWIVHKFGGSSVADADCFTRVATLLESLPPGPLAVVLSACRGVTDALLGLISLAEQQDDAFAAELARLRERHAQIADQLLATTSARTYLAGFDRDCQDLEGILRTVKLTRSAAREVSDLIAGYGEIWSTQLFYRYFEERSGSTHGVWCWSNGSRSGRRCSGRTRTRAWLRSSRPALPAPSSSPASSQARRAACRRRSGATAATSRLPFLAPSLMRARSISGRMSMAFYPPIRAACPMPR